MATDVYFQFGFVPHTAADEAARGAVLYPLMGAPQSDAETRRYVGKLVASWRWRVTQLLDNDANLGKAGKRGSMYLRNCCPTFAYPTPTAKTCRQWLVCPFCYARRVSDVWERIAAAFPPGERREPTVVPIEESPKPVREVDLYDYSDWVEEDEPEPIATPPEVRQAKRILLYERVERDTGWDFKHRLVVCRKRQYESFDGIYRMDDVKDRLRDAMCAQLSEAKAWLSAREYSGALLDCVVEPDQKKSRWRLETRYLLCVSPDAEFHPHEVNGPGIYFEDPVKPTREALKKAVRKVCRYPVGMMRADPHLAATIINVKKELGLRMHEVYGTFRRKKNAQEA